MDIMYFFFTIKKIISVFSGTLLGNIKFRLWNCKVSGIVKCFGVPYIEKTPESKIEIGSNVVLRSSLVSNVAGCFHPVVLATRKKGTVVIGDNSGISSSVIVSEVSVTVGKNVLIGVNCVISDTDFHSVSAEVRKNSALDKENHRSLPVVIEDDVWLGVWLPRIYRLIHLRAAILAKL